MLALETLPITQHTYLQNTKGYFTTKCPRLKKLLT
jgi:hypothetical protein